MKCGLIVLAVERGAAEAADLLDPPDVRVVDGDVVGEDLLHRDELLLDPAPVEIRAAHAAAGRAVSEVRPVRCALAVDGDPVGQRSRRRLSLMLGAVEVRAADARGVGPIHVLIIHRDITRALAAMKLGFTLLPSRAARPIVRPNQSSRCESESTARPWGVPRPVMNLRSKSLPSRLRAPDPPLLAVGPVEVVLVHRDPVDARPGADVALVDALAVGLRAPDRRVVAVRPVDVGVRRGGAESSSARRRGRSRYALAPHLRGILPRPAGRKSSDARFRRPCLATAAFVIAVRRGETAGEPRAARTLPAGARIAAVRVYPARGARGPQGDAGVDRRARSRACARRSSPPRCATAWAIAIRRGRSGRGTRSAMRCASAARGRGSSSR